MGDRWQWRRRLAAGASTPELARAATTPEEVAEEYSGYVTRLTKVLLSAAAIAITGVIVLFLLAWRSSVAPSESMSVRVVLVPVSASTAAAGLSILAAVAIALQLAVRTPSETETTPARALGRRRFLCETARLVVLASFALAVYATIPAFATAPEELDLVRLLAPGLGALCVGVVAADAAVAADPDFAPDEVGRVARARARALLRHGIDSLSPGVRVARPARLGETFVLAAPSAAVGFASSFAMSGLNPLQRVLLAAIAAVVALIIYSLAVSVYVKVVTRQWVDLALSAAFCSCIGFLFWLLTAYGVLIRTAETRSFSAAATTAAWGITYLAVPGALAAWSLSKEATTRGGVLARRVLGVLTRRLDRLRDPVFEVNAQAKRNVLAVISPFVSPLLPFGMILAVVAKRQIRQANSGHADARQIGMKWADTAIWLTLAFSVLAALGFFVVAAIDIRY